MNITEIFYLLDQIFMLFAYKNRKNKILITFSFLQLRGINVFNFTFGWVQYHARRDTGDNRAVTSIQERLSRNFAIPQSWTKI